LCTGIIEIKLFYIILWKIIYSSGKISIISIVTDIYNFSPRLTKWIKVCYSWSDMLVFNLDTSASVIHEHTSSLTSISIVVQFQPIHIFFQSCGSQIQQSSFENESNEAFIFQRPEFPSIERFSKFVRFQIVEGKEVILIQFSN